MALLFYVTLPPPSGHRHLCTIKKTLIISVDCTPTLMSRNQTPFQFVRHTREHLAITCSSGMVVHAGLPYADLCLSCVSPCWTCKSKGKIGWHYYKIMCCTKYSFHSKKERNEILPGYVHHKWYVRQYYTLLFAFVCQSHPFSITALVHVFNSTLARRTHEKPSRKKSQKIQVVIDSQFSMIFEVRVSSIFTTSRFHYALLN